MAQDAVWYEARPLGINSLAKMMKTISEEARLSKIYTNHCVRATAITLWSNAGISNRHIMAISGHRSEQSLESYNSRPSTSQLHSCSKSCREPFLLPPTITTSHQKLLSNPRRSRPNKWQRNRSSANALFKTCKLFSTVPSLKFRPFLNDFGRLSTFFSLFIILLNYFTGCLIQTLGILSCI
jgi:hypothetical protein